jgi:hypothetical protein
MPLTVSMIMPSMMTTCTYAERFRWLALAAALRSGPAIGRIGFGSR